MTELNMRDARAEDQDAIREVTLAAYQEYAAVMQPENWGRYRDNFLGTLADVKPAEQIVAEQDGAIAGTVLLYPAGMAITRPGGDTFTLPSPEIRLLAVAPAARGQGVGAALVRECMRRARQAEATAVTLHTTDMMHVAMSMYERMGFVRAPELDFEPAPGFFIKGYRYRFDDYRRVARLADVQAAACLTVQADGHTLALWSYGDQVYAVDNRCPHMGFPLNQGTVKDGILICHWHHARFDLASGGTFDQFADDVRTYPVALREGEVWVDLTPRPVQQQRRHQRERLRDGLERDIPLVMAKAILTLMDGTPAQAVEPFRIGLDFGTHYREAGWGQGLTILTCMMNLLPHVAAEDRPRALYQGLSAVARESAGMAPRFLVRSLPGQAPDLPTLKRWFRQFVEVRDAEGAERALVSAVRASNGSAGPGPDADQAVVPEAERALIADILFTAATDHRYIQIGHVLDFTNKALEALDLAGWEAGRAELVLSSLAAGYANASRMEESNAWRSPLDLIALLDEAFVELPGALEIGRERRVDWSGSAREKLTPALLGEEPAATVAALMAILREGCPPVDAAGAVAYAAALRIARFHTSNEFTDWDTALHTFTFANAVHQGLRRSASAGLVRGVFDAAMSLYLDRFLNVPAAALPQPPAGGGAADARDRLAELPALLDRQQQVEPAAELVAQYLFASAADASAAGASGDAHGDASSAASSHSAALLAMLGKLLLREDRDFHTIQTVEAAFRQYALLSSSDGDSAQASAAPEAVNVLVAATRYLAAHAPTMRAQGQTYQIAQRLARGDRIFEG